MQTRRWILGGGGATLAGAAAVALSAQGQTPPAAPAPEPPPVANPQYYQGKVSPPPPGLFPGQPAAPPAALPVPAPKPPAGPATGQPMGFSPPVTPTTTVRPNLKPPAPGAVGANLSAAGLPPGPVNLADPRKPVAPDAGPIRTAGAVESTPTGTPPFFMPPVAPPAPLGLPEPKPLPSAGAAEPPALPLMPAAPAPSPPGMVPEVVGLPDLPPATAPAAPPAMLPASPTASAPVPPLPTAAPSNAFAEPPPAAPVVTTPAKTTPAESTAAMPARQAPLVTIDFVAPESVGVGQPLTYELVVRNSGPMAVSGVRVEEDIPARTQLVATDPPAESTGERLSFLLGTLESAAERRVRITVKASDEGELKSRASVSFAASVEAKVRVTRPKIGLTVVGPEASRVGDRVTFKIKLANSGTGPAGKVQLRANFTDGLAHSQGQVIETELKDVGTGQAREFHLEVAAAKSGAQVCTINAVADGQASEPARSTVSVVEPMLAIKLAGPSKCLVKSEPTFTVELSNAGTAATDAVTLWAALPAGMELVQATDQAAFVDENRSVAWQLPGLPAGSSKVLTMKLRATSPVEGAIRAVAQTGRGEVVQAGGTTGVAMPAPRRLNASAEAPIRAEGVPALRFDVMAVEGAVEVGKEAVYEIRILNQGTGPCTGVQLACDLAETTQATGATGQTAGKVAGQQVTFDTLPTLGVKGEAVYKVRVRGTAAGDYRIRVRLSCEQFRSPVVKEENTRFYKE